MDRVETKALLTLVSTLDQRIVSDGVVDAWASLLKDVSRVYASEAVEEHFREKPDTYLNVGHVVAGAKRAAKRDQENMVAQARELEESDWKADPQPVCEEHSLRILECLECCNRIFEQADDMNADNRHSWAMAHVYKPKEAWASA